MPSVPHAVASLGLLTCVIACCDRRRRLAAQSCNAACEKKAQSQRMGRPWMHLQSKLGGWAGNSRSCACLCPRRSPATASWAACGVQTYLRAVFIVESAQLVQLHTAWRGFSPASLLSWTCRTSTAFGACPTSSAQSFPGSVKHRHAARFTPAFAASSTPGRGVQSRPSELGRLEEPPRQRRSPLHPLPV